MTMHNCQSRTTDDASTLLYPISKYTNFLYDFYDFHKIIIGAIAGPYEQTLTVNLNTDMEPKLGFSCSTSGESEDGAVPAVRIKEFVETFVTSEDDKDWAFTSVCNEDYSPALEGFGNKIKLMQIYGCPPTPILGCPDPAAANGLTPITELQSPERETCVPDCSVYESTPDGSAHDIELCAPDSGPDGDGHPPKIWDGLEEPCYHIIYNEICDLGINHASSRGAEIIISRKENPPLGTSTRIGCKGFPLNEENCTDDKDNDFDGNTDNSDPDCL